jgi:hypothetical protein
MQLDVGIGSILGFGESNQASAIWAGVAYFAVAIQRLNYYLV